MTEQQPEMGSSPSRQPDASVSDVVWDETKRPEAEMQRDAGASASNGGRAWWGPDEDDDTTYLTQSR